MEIPPEKDELVIPDHMKEAFDRDTEQSRAALEQQMKQSKLSFQQSFSTIYHYDYIYIIILVIIKTSEYIHNTIVI